MCSQTEILPKCYNRRSIGCQSTFGLSRSIKQFYSRLSIRFESIFGSLISIPELIQNIVFHPQDPCYRVFGSNQSRYFLNGLVSGRSSGFPWIQFVNLAFTSWANYCLDHQFIFYVTRNLLGTQSEPTRNSLGTQEPLSRTYLPVGSLADLPVHFNRCRMPSKFLRTARPLMLKCFSSSDVLAPRWPLMYFRINVCV